MAASSRSDWREMHAHSSDRAAGAGPRSRSYRIRQNSAANPRPRFDGPNGQCRGAFQAAAEPGLIGGSDGRVCTGIWRRYRNRPRDAD